MNYISKLFVRQVTGRLGQRTPLYLSVLFVTLAYSFLSILRYLHFKSSYDLCILDQGIWQYSSLRAPYISVRSNLLTENLLGDHLSPILAVFAPLYWVTDRVEALLVAQALLFAIPIIPIFLFTRKRLGSVPAYLFAFSYALFWGVQKAVEYDFHEIAIAVPAIALAIYFIDQKRWPAYFLCMGILLLTKEDLSLMVVFFGLYLIALRQFKLGLVSVAAGIVWLLAAIKILIPSFFEPGALGAESHYRHWSYGQFGSGPLSATWTMIRHPLFVVRTLLSPGTKLHTYWYTFHPFLFLPFFSPLFILAVPLIAERFLSENPSFWGLDYHYTATLAPLIVMASVDSLFRITRRLRKTPRHLITSVSILVFAANLFLLPRFPLWNLTSADNWRLSASDTIGRKAVSMIPPTASVVASGLITPHLTHRREIYMLSPLTKIPDAEFIIASERLDSFPFPNFEEVRYYLDYQQARGYRRVFDQEGWIILQREPTGEESAVVYNNAVFVDQLVPTVMTAGESYSTQITMRNTGISPWSSSEAYALALVGRDWGIERVRLPATVNVNANLTFKFTVKAPAVPGQYRFRCKMVQEGLMFFGETTREISVSVVERGPSTQ